jgi:hypothetical protein
MELIRKALYDSDLEFRKNWDAMQEWSEQSRYERIPPETAEALLNAVSEKRHGMIQWIKQHW